MRLIQVSGEYIARDAQMAEYLQLVLRLKFKIPRSENNHVESLSNLGATTEFQFRWEIPVKHNANRIVQQLIGEVLRLDTSPGWRDHIIAYLKDRTLPDDRAEAQKLLYVATRCTLLGDALYKKSYFKLHADSYLRCLGPDEAQRDAGNSWW